jgi:hypothetical protein
VEGRDNGKTCSTYAASNGIFVGFALDSLAVWLTAHGIDKRTLLAAIFTSAWHSVDGRAIFGCIRAAHFTVVPKHKLYRVNLLLTE